MGLLLFMVRAEEVGSLLRVRGHEQDIMEVSLSNCVPRNGLNRVSLWQKELYCGRTGAINVIC